MSLTEALPPSPSRALSARLFIALWPEPQVRQALAACRDATAWPAGAAPVASEKLHATLHFIGSVPDHRVGEVTAALQVPAEPFEWCLELVDCWRGGLAVLCPRTVPPPLHALHADLAPALRRLALPVETRAFRPHVTLARRALPCQPVAPAEPVRWRVDGYALVRSMPDGRYELLRRYR